MISRSDLKFDKTDTCTLIITDMTKFEFDDVEISTVFFFGLFDIHQSFPVEREYLEKSSLPCSGCLPSF